jgi:hypothetical protein
LYSRLGLEWAAKAERFIEESDRTGDNRTYSMTRPTAQQIDKWNARVRPEDVEACRAFVEPFGLPYYPGFDPAVRTISGVEPAGTRRSPQPTA